MEVGTIAIVPTCLTFSVTMLPTTVSRGIMDGVGTALAL